SDKNPGCLSCIAPPAVNPNRSITVGSSPHYDTKQRESDSGLGLATRKESPWNNFRKYYDCDLAGPVAVYRGVWAVRQYPIENADKILRILRSMRHKNLTSMQKYFCTPELLYTLGDFDPLVLDYIVACKAFPDKQELAAIISQVCFLFLSTCLPYNQMTDLAQFIAGLLYLVANNFHHISLDCSSVPVNLNRYVKIGKFIPLLPPKSIQPNKAR
ncbi:hypothetical protein N7481_002919, partial [Penicillium waksmanii]|uniref:uncharacterized protein n=1 Tax=Penicillium waksmanii TaxID=69791 RepID=UPI0025465E6E